MGWLIALIIGGLVGWLISYTVRQERRGASVLTGIISGAAGGILGPLFFGNLLGLTGALNRSIGDINFLGFLWSLIGALVLGGIALGAIALPGMGGRREATGRSYAEEIRKRNDRER